MNKGTLTMAAALAAGLAGAEVLVTVDPAKEVGPIKIMNAVNNGPSKARADQSRGNFADYRALRIPYARTHDSINQATSNGHTVDISAVFPNFDADENDPKNYDFAYTDRFLETILAAGTEPFFRLGQTIENGIKKYHVFPPKDYAKWARICEHVIRHCNEGWCGGHEWDIRYWEIWNEADAQPDEKKSESCQWQGTKAEFFEFYKIVALHLKKRFPKLKIGGPALGHRLDWAEEFLRYQQAAGTPIDFFSWHWYGRIPVGDRGPKGPTSLAGKCFLVREMLDRCGYGKAESVLDEWNYVKNWTDDFPHTSRIISEPKGGAFAAAAMSGCQDAPLDMLMYYDARPGTVFNGLFDIYTFKPRPAYYAFLAWSWLRDLGVQVGTDLSFPGREKLVADANSKQWREWYRDYENPGTITNEIVTATAAFSNGKVGVFVTRFCDDDNVTAPEKVTVRLRKGAFNGLVRAYVTDRFHTGSAMTVIPEKDGSLVLSMEPNSFVYVEAELKPLDVAMTFDDGVKDHLLVAAPELEKRGWRGIFCIIPDWIGKDGKRLTWDDVRELKHRGHEIANHTLSHADLGKLAREGKLDEVRRQIAAGRDAIAKETGEAPKVLCIPFGSIEPEVYRIAAEEGQVVLPVDRANFGEGSGPVSGRIDSHLVRADLFCDILSHGIRKSGGGWRPFPTESEFVAHLDGIAAYGDRIRVVTGPAAHAAMDRHRRATDAAGFGLTQDTIGK